MVERGCYIVVDKITVWYKNGTTYERIVTDIKLWDENRNVSLTGYTERNSYAITIYLPINDTLKNQKPNSEMKVLPGDIEFELTASNLADFVRTYKPHTIQAIDLKDFGGLKHLVLGVQ